MKVAISIYSFMQYIRDGKATPIELIIKVKELGFDAVEFVDFVFPEGECPIEYAKKLKAECDRVGLPVSNYAFGADFLNGSDGDMDAEIDKAKKNIDIAAALGSPRVRHDVTRGLTARGYKGYEDLIPYLSTAIREVTEYAATKGIRTTTENHGFFSQDSRRVEKLVNSVAHENFGLLVDIGNFLCADEDPAIAVGRVAPYAFYAHAKDFIVKNGNGINPGQGFFQSRNGNFLRGTIVGHGDVPVMHCLRALKNAGYDDIIAIEFEGMEDCTAGASIGLANLRSYIAEVYGE